VLVCAIATFFDHTFGNVFNEELQRNFSKIDESDGTEKFSINKEFAKDSIQALSDMEYILRNQIELIQRQSNTDNGPITIPTISPLLSQTIEIKYIRNALYYSVLPAASFKGMLHLVLSVDRSS
jgi:hypothetical protein